MSLPSSALLLLPQINYGKHRGRRRSRCRRVGAHGYRRGGGGGEVGPHGSAAAARLFEVLQVSRVTWRGSRARTLVGLSAAAGRGALAAAEEAAAEDVWPVRPMEVIGYARRLFGAALGCEVKRVSNCCLNYVNVDADVV